jgi:hypothetical protein
MFLARLSNVVTREASNSGREDYSDCRLSINFNARIRRGSSRIVPRFFLPATLLYLAISRVFLFSHSKSRVITADADKIGG